MKRALCALLLTLGSVATADTVVRVANTDSQKLPPTLITSQAVDFGSYTLLRLDSAGLRRLQLTQTPFQILEQADVIRFGEHAFDPLDNPPIPADVPTTADGNALRLVQWSGPPQQNDLDALRELGLKTLQYYPGNAYLVWGSADAINRARSQHRVRWTGRFSENFKPSADFGKRAGLLETVAVLFYNDGKPDQTIDALRNVGARVLRWHAAQPDLRFLEAIVVIEAKQARALGRIPQVLWYGYQSPKWRLEDEMSDQIVAGNYVGGLPQLGYLGFLGTLGLDGTGVTWAITDSGVDLTHPEFVGRIAGGYDYPGCPVGSGPGDDNPAGGHGTHVAGIVAATGILGLVDSDGFNYALGVAPGAQLFAQNPLCVSSVPWPPVGGWQELSKRALAGSALGTNASWASGAGLNNGYQSAERTFDFLVRDGDFDTLGIAEPFYIVFSAGDRGPAENTITEPKEAKNPIVVGASVNRRVGSIESVADFSSRGPSLDGRTFPTLVAPGAMIASTQRVAGAQQCTDTIAGTDSQMSFCSGTSMAAPHVSGLAALLVQWWRMNNAGANPSPAMLKALMVNGAQDMQNVGTIPNNGEGWGRVHLPDTLADGVSRHYIDQTEVIDNTGDVYELQVSVIDGGEPLRITLAWSDTPGAVGANPALVNDLDLEVEVDGQTYLGNVFANGLSATGGRADNINNTENVFLSSATGSITIRVRGTTVPGDGVPFVGDSTDQDFALVCTNCAQIPNYTLTATTDAQDICAPSDAVYPLDIGSILGYTDPVTLSVTGEPAGTTAIFSDNPVTPPATSTLTIGSTGAATAGDFTLDLQASSTAGPQSRDLQLVVSTTAPAAPTLNLPADGADNQLVQPTLSWSEPAQGGQYLVEIADDQAFSNIIDSATVSELEYTTPVVLNTNSTYYWRIQASNACGMSAASAARSFKTVPAPGDCTTGNQTNTEYSYDFETGAGDWTSSGTGDTWAQSDTQANSGTFSWHADDPVTVSDQRLVSPPISLPADQLPLTLQFFHWRDLEERSAGGCWDAGVLEVSADGGNNWTQVDDADLLTDPYTGTVNGTTNPLGGQQAWCDAQDWTRSIVDVASWAGQTVQFRFRLGSDGSVGADGWYIDDVRVQSCGIGNSIFGNGFE